MTFTVQIFDIDDESSAWKEARLQSGFDGDNYKNCVMRLKDKCCRNDGYSLCYYYEFEVRDD